MKIFKKRKLSEEIEKYDNYRLAEVLELKDDIQPVADVAQADAFKSIKKLDKRAKEAFKEAEKNAEPVVKSTHNRNLGIVDKTDAMKKMGLVESFNKKFPSVDYSISHKNKGKFLKVYTESLNQAKSISTWASSNKIPCYIRKSKGVYSCVLKEEWEDEDVCRTGIAQDLNYLIKDELEAVEGYNSVLATWRDADKFPEVIAVLKDIVDEEMLHIGQLQRALELVSPNAKNIQAGAKEAEEQIVDEAEKQKEKEIEKAEEKFRDKVDVEVEDSIEDIEDGEEEIVDIDVVEESKKIKNKKLKEETEPSISTQTLEEEDDEDDEEWGVDLEPEDLYPLLEKRGVKRKDLEKAAEIIYYIYCDENFETGFFEDYTSKEDLIDFIDSDLDERAETVEGDEPFAANFDEDDVRWLRKVLNIHSDDEEWEDDEEDDKLDESYEDEEFKYPKHIDEKVNKTLKSNRKLEDVKKLPNGKWANVGKDGKADSGTFKTKKEAEAQMRAMYANGYKESIKKEGMKDTLDAYVKGETLEERYEPYSSFKTFEYKDKTEQGYDVVKVFRDLDDDRVHIIFHRTKPEDYNIGLGYSLDDGVWNQGRYNFNSVEDAEEILKRKYNVEDITDTFKEKKIEVKEDLEEDYKKSKYSLSEIEDAVSTSFGFNKKETKDYIKKSSPEVLDALVAGFKAEASKSFLTDDLKKKIEVKEDLEEEKIEKGPFQVIWYVMEDDHPRCECFKEREKAIEYCNKHKEDNDKLEMQAVEVNDKDEIVDYLVL